MFARELPDTDNYEIYARRADGTAGHPLALPHANPYTPAVSPDGTSLIYTTFTQQSLYLHRFADGSDVELDNAHASSVRLPTLSPDGTLAAFDDSLTVFLTPTNGAPGRMLVPESALPGNAGHPVFTADSQRVVFGVPDAVESLGIDGTGLEALLPDEGSFSGPGNLAFSPDFANLVAVGLCPGDQVPVMRVYSVASLPSKCASGRAIATNFQSGPGPWGNPVAWGPDGLIAYQSFPDIMVVTAAGGAPWNLTQDLTAWGGAPKSGTIEVLGSLTPTFAPACTKL